MREIPAPSAIVSVVHGRRDGRQLRVEFELWIKAGDERLYVTLVERVKYPAMELNVLLGHRLSLFRVAESCRTAYHATAAPREERKRPELASADMVLLRGERTGGIKMRNVVVSTYVTLDGVFENPAWSAPYWSDEAQQFAHDQLWTSDALLVGRTTYEEFAAAWPTDEWIEREGDFAERMNSLPKYVASSTLAEPLAWNNSRLLEGDVAEEVRKLKEEPGQDILMYSSVTLMHALMGADLVDRYRLWLHPLILGSGKQLFSGGTKETELKLMDKTTLPNDVIVLSYQPADR
jgi:dihydrofolate reductase